MTAVSVCMASYNGARFVEAQLRSILAELEPHDEVVIVDDASTDDTVASIRRIGDPRIRLYTSERNRGYVQTFEDAVRRARGDVIFLSDQDDEWIPGRRDLLVDALAHGDVAASNLVLLGSDAPLRSPIGGRPWLLRSSDSGRRVRNELRILAGIAPYFGCTMAFTRRALPLILPFPAYLDESHDLWIATAANRASMLVHIDEPTVRRRVHDENASSARPRAISRILSSRYLMVRLLAEANSRARRLRRAR